MERVFGAASQVGLKSDVALADRINVNGSAPAIVRLTDSDLSRDFFPTGKAAVDPSDMPTAGRSIGRIAD